MIRFRYLWSRWTLETFLSPATDKSPGEILTSCLWLIERLTQHTARVGNISEFLNSLLSSLSLWGLTGKDCVVNVFSVSCYHGLHKAFIVYLQMDIYLFLLLHSCRWAFCFTNANKAILESSIGFQELIFNFVNQLRGGMNWRSSLRKVFANEVFLNKIFNWFYNGVSGRRWLRRS